MTKILQITDSWLEIVTYIIAISSSIYYISPWNKSFTFFHLFVVSQVPLKFQYFLYSLKDYWTNQELNWMEKLTLVVVHRFAEYWHNYEIHGLEKIKNLKGGRLLVGYHSRNTLDLYYMIASLKPKILVSYLFFKIPIFSKYLPLIGLLPSKVDGDQKNEDSFVEALLNSHEKPLMLLPGGVIECLKSYEDQYRVGWKTNPGFGRVIFENQAKFQKDGVSVIPFYTKNSERIFYSTPYWYDWSGKYGVELYQRFKNGEILLLSYMFSFFISCLGIGFPLPLKLDVYFGKPITMKTNETAENFSFRVSKHLEQIMEVVNENEDSQIIQDKIDKLDTETLNRNGKDTISTKLSREERIQYIDRINQLDVQKDFKHHLQKFSSPIYLIFFFIMLGYLLIHCIIYYLLFIPLIWSLFPPIVIIYCLQSVAKVFGFGDKSKKRKLN